MSALVKISARNETLQVKSSSVATTITPMSFTTTSAVTVSSTVAPTSTNSQTMIHSSPTSKSVMSGSHKHALKSPTDGHRSAGPETAASRSDDPFWSTPGVHGAVVALSLGVVITATLLVYAGCRFRRIRKLASRRRRPAGNNDADYLVNGMYL